MPSYKSTSSVLLFACCLTPAFSYLEEVEVHFTPDQEAQLAQLATKAGTDAEHLVKAAALRLLEDETYFHVQRSAHESEGQTVIFLLISDNCHYRL